MRLKALAAVAVCIGLSMGVASARPYNDPQGRVTFDNPAGWSTLVSRNVDQTQYTYLVTGSANNECQVAAIPNPATASHTPASVNTNAADITRFTNEVWATSLNRFGEVFPNNSAQVQSTTTDTSGFWPIQRAEVQSPEHLVHAAMEFRPGLEIVVMCLTYGGADPTNVYDTFIRSVGTSHDAEWQAAAAAAAAAAPAPAPTPQH
jgi:hypothetical protein